VLCVGGVALCVRVMQCGYDLSCEQGQHCSQDHRVPFCKTNATCLDEMTLRWQDLYIGALQARYEVTG
jgi:hypothetical protein